MHLGDSFSCMLDQTKIAIEAYKSGNDEAAVEAALKAEKSNPDIQFIIGTGYEWGEGVDGNLRTALEWYRRAATQGHEDAMCGICRVYIEMIEDLEFDEWPEVDAIKSDFELVSGSSDSDVKSWVASLYVKCVYGKGQCSDLGELIQVDKSKDLDFIKLAAGNGSSTAQYQLARHYENGDGLPQDDEEAIKWYRLAAENGSNHNVYHKLGHLYEKGICCEADYDEAIKWYRKAFDIAQNNTSRISLAHVYLLAGRLNESAEWYLKAAETGYGFAQCQIGRFYSRGVGVREDHDEAFRWYMKAAENDNAVAQRMVGDCYNIGAGVRVDKEMAAKWYRRATDNGDYGAREKLSEVLKQIEESRSQKVVREPTREQKTEIGRVVDSIIGGSGIRGASFSEDADNPFSFIMFIPITTPERLVVDACAKLFRHLGLVSSGEVLTMGRYLDYCGVVRGGTSDGECYVASFNHPMAKIIGRGSPQAQYIIKNWINGDDEDDD